MSKVMFIKPALETDAVWDPVRTSPYLGIWYLASKLKSCGHEVVYSDEVVRNGGLQKKELFTRFVMTGEDKSFDIPLREPYEVFQSRKMRHYHECSPEYFARINSTFNWSKAVSRVIARTGNSIEDTLSEVEKISPDIVGIPLIATANYLPVTRLAKSIKDNFPKIKIISGGQAVSADPNTFVAENPSVDQVVTGDAISVIKDIVNGKLTDRIVHGGFQKMEEFPLLDPSIIENAGYPAQPTYTYPTSGRKYVDFMFSKGCFRKCDFCVAGSQTGNHVTATAYDRIDRQLAEFKRHGIQELVVQDDAFLHDSTHRKEHVSTVLGLMKKHGMFWQNNGGVEFEGLDDFVTDQLIKYNQEGEGRVTSLYVPFNPRTWNKNESAAKSMSSKYHHNAENLKRLRQDGGIYVFTSAIIGTPEQTETAFNEELETDRELIEKGYLDSALPLSATMLPATKWYDSNGHNIIDKKDYAGYSLFTTHHRTDHLTPQDIERLMVTWNKSLDDFQKTYSWQTAFPNSGGQK